MNKDILLSIIEEEKTKFKELKTFIMQPIVIDDFINIGKNIYDERKVLFSKLDIKKENKILDVGCNCGTNSFILSELFGATIHGCDINKQAIDFASIVLNYYNIDNNKNYNILFKNDDVFNLELKDYDYILWHYLEDFFSVNERTVYSPSGFGFKKSVEMLYEKGFTGKIIMVYCLDTPKWPYSPYTIQQQNNRKYETLEYYNCDIIDNKMFIIDIKNVPNLNE